MKILIFGFKPYLNYKKNISEEVAKKLVSDDKIQVKKIILPSNLRSKKILDDIKKYCPDVIVGLGQTSRGGRIRIEKRAKNYFKSLNRVSGAEIKRGDKKYYFTNLKLKKLPQTIVSYDAGTYVCNLVMYLILNFLKRSRRQIKFGFLHIPFNSDAIKTTEIISKMIKTINL